MRRIWELFVGPRGGSLERTASVGTTTFDRGAVGEKWRLSVDRGRRWSAGEDEDVELARKQSERVHRDDDGVGERDERQIIISPRFARA